MIVYAVDDEKNNIELLEEYLNLLLPNAEKHYFTVAKDLLKEEKNKPCDIAILDIMMPGMTGLELAEKIKKIKNDTNIIFLTAFGGYTKNALDMFTSGYVMKPISKNTLKEQLDNLRYPIKELRAKAITFGNFDFIVDGEHVAFRLKKSKELLAYLIDRKGAIVTRKEVASILFEDGSYSRNQQKQLSQIVSNLKQTLKKYDLEALFIQTKDGYGINVQMLKCDLYDYISKRLDINYQGEYMEQYSWGEMFKLNNQ